jgi:hypothetical protein
VQYADEPVGELAQRCPVAGPAGTELVAAGAGAGRCAQSGVRLSHEGVDEPVVVHLPGKSGFLSGRR